MSRTVLPIVFTKRASRQLEQANAWWRTHRAGAPTLLHDELARVLELLEQHPHIGTRAGDSELSDVRRVLLPATGYFLYYRVQPRLGQLQVLAIWHTRRGRGPLI